MTEAALVGSTLGLDAPILASLEAAESRDQPFINWRLANMLPETTAHALAGLPLRVLDHGGVSGKRELHNDQRVYFAGPTLERFPVARQLAEAFQSPQVVQALMLLTGALLVGAYLRIEYTLDINGFWLEPHTDLGVKVFTMLFQLGSPGQEGLGTDLYHGPGQWSETVPFGWNSALLFVPSERTWHGLEPRRIEGVRRSIIINYVADEWRARDQLAFPDRPVRGA